MLMGRTFDNSELQGSEERILDLSRDDATKRFQHLLSIVANNRDGSPVIIENGLLVVTPMHFCGSRPDV